VALLWDAGHVLAAIQLEALWNQLGQEVAFSLFCAYGAGSVDDGHSDAFADVCHLHSVVIDNRSGSADQADDVSPEQVRVFPNSPRAPRAARRFVVETLQRWGRQELIDDAAIVTTELVANAVMHARSDAVVTVSSLGEGVRVAVRDFSRAVPRPGPRPASVGGRGLVLVAALSSLWSTELVDGGKVVWSELRPGS
jgi:anti-sigma regulatory factor (Ser/Thr protein kinase)